MVLSSLPTHSITLYVGFRDIYGYTSIDFSQDDDFIDFKQSLDAEMKRLQSD